MQFFSLCIYIDDALPLLHSCNDQVSAAPCFSDYHVPGNQGLRQDNTVAFLPAAADRAGMDASSSPHLHKSR